MTSGRGAIREWVERPAVLLGCWNLPPADDRPVDPRPWRRDPLLGAIGLDSCPTHWCRSITIDDAPAAACKISGSGTGASETWPAALESSRE